MGFIEKPRPVYKHGPRISVKSQKLMKQMARQGGLHAEDKVVPSAPDNNPSAGLINEQLTPQNAEGHIIAWRRWALTLSENNLRPRLGSMGHGFWPSDRPAYGKDLDRLEMAGINCYNTPELSKKNYIGLHVYGRVAIWGRIEIYELGYRAEYARPITLNLARRPAENAEAILLLLLQEYNCQPERLAFNSSWIDIPCTIDPITQEPL